MVQVKFHDKVNDNLLKFSVIFSKSDGNWVFCKRKNRDTYECPGGRIITTAKRELFEETGAIEYNLNPICIYSILGYDGVHPNTQETYGMVFYANIETFGEMPDFEMEKIELFYEI